MATKIEISTILGHAPDDGRTKIAKTKIICTLGPKSREVPILEKLLRAGMNVARFNFSHGSFEYQQYTLDNLRRAMHNTQLMCAVLLDTKVGYYFLPPPATALSLASFLPTLSWF
jgi:pyruvate kinase